MRTMTLLALLLLTACAAPGRRCSGPLRAINTAITKAASVTAEAPR
jgi:hypothetical protein